MVFDLGTTEQAFPLIQVIFGGSLLWLGFNLEIVTVTEEETDE